MARYFRDLAGVLIKDWPRYRRALSAPDASYLTLCNRQESLVPSPDGGGYVCDWQWTSELHAPNVLPSLGRWLMRCALGDHPIRRLPQPEHRSANPEISFIIGHRGTERLPHLLATLESIAGQRGVPVECIVVEQETESRLSGRLPAWVRHIHSPPPARDMPYCRSWAFDLGAGAARAPVLVLHDNDMLVPLDYAAQICVRVQEGFEVVNLKRFIFYLEEGHSHAVFDDERGLLERPPKVIVQNTEGGGSVAITRGAFERIGGMDETFVGWGGEDNELWERAQTCRVWPYGCLSLVHLWHPSQPRKGNRDNPMLRHYRELATIPVAERIKRLRSRGGGRMDGPCRQQGA